MIVEFAVENFRSIKSRQVFSLVAESSKVKGDNVFEVGLPHGGSVRLLKTALIYGANASGKSNFIKALGRLIQMIDRRTSGAGRPIKGYDPFLFSSETIGKPTVYELTFIFEGVKYQYKVIFNLEQVVEEKMVFFPKGQSQGIFERLGEPHELLHKIKMGKNFGSKEIEVFNNQLALNKFGTDTPHELLTKIYVYFHSININNAMQGASSTIQVRRTSRNLARIDRQTILRQLENLLKVADTKIDRLEIVQTEGSTPLVGRNGEITRTILDNRLSTQVYGIHKVFDNGREVGIEKLNLDEESEGTRALFWRGGLILEKLEQGGILVFDELDNSMHPKLVKFLVSLFSNSLSNPNNAQLIFATHEVTLLDRDMFRTDQIWFTEKNQYGETEIFSAQDFDGVREDVPFDKWYMAGKFGGLPKIEDIESVFTL